MRIQELIGRNVRQAREEADLSQRELGQRIGNVLGKPWHPQAVSAAEKGGRDWAAEDLVAVAFVLGRTIESLFHVPNGAKPSDILDLPGETPLHLGWVSGEASEVTQDKIASEMQRLANQLNAIAKPATVGAVASVPTPSIRVSEKRKRNKR